MSGSEMFKPRGGAESAFSSSSNCSSTITATQTSPPTTNFVYSLSWTSGSESGGGSASFSY